jgi:hypothetical protein
MTLYAGEWANEPPEWYPGDDEELRPMKTPRGYIGVEHEDGTVHAIDIDKIPDDGPVWRSPVVCGAATGVSSDEGGSAALHKRELTCWECISILS